MSRRGWTAYLALSTLALAAYLFIHPIRVGPLFNLICFSAPVAIVVSVTIRRPARRLPWLLFALGQTLFVAGDVVTYNYERFFGSALPFPSAGDAFYLAVYPCLILGLLLLTRRRSPGRDRESLIDAMIVATGVGVVSWVLLMAPIARSSDLDMVSKLVSIGYPLMDLMVLTAAIRLAVGTGKRPASFYLMIAAIVGLFLTDSVYSWISIHGIVYDNSTGLLEGGWGLFYILWGAAALHVSMNALDEPTEARELRHPRQRLFLLAGASLMAPALQLILVANHEPVDVPVLAGAAGVLFVLVLIRLNGLMVDVNEHRKTERELRDAETKYRTLVEGLPAVVYLAEFGEEGGWRYVSPQIEMILGYSQEQFMTASKLWRERIVPEDREAAMAAELQLLNGGDRMRCEYRIRAFDGRLIWIREEAEALKDDSGRARFLQGVMYDVTQEKEGEDRLREALEAEKEVADRLRGVQEMQNSFLQAVSHDLRTPLTTILGNALTLEQNAAALTPEERLDLIRRTASNARRLQRLLTDLLDLDRMTRGSFDLRRSLTDLTELAAHVIDELAIDSHPVRLVTTEPVLVRIDPTQIERVIENLILNAVRYTPPGTPIWVTSSIYLDGVLLVVDDAGPGVRDELKSAIFEPFRQGEETVPHSPGVGIGLALVHRFATLHGGRAWVEDRAGGGASFRIYLPGGRTRKRSLRHKAPGAIPSDRGGAPDRPTTFPEGAST
jgi:PAS domain S-box-containing protein